MDPPADERLPAEAPAEAPAGGSPFAEQSPTWRPPTIPPRYVGPIGPAPWYGLHPYAPPSPGSTPIATWALILSIIAASMLLGCWPLSTPMALAAAVLAIIAKQQIKQAPETPGDSQATAALVISGIILGLAAMGFALWMVMIGLMLWGGF